MISSRTMNIHKHDDLVYLSFPKIDASGVADCVFTTKLGGASLGKFSTMNMSYSRGDDPEHVRKNYETICGAAGLNADRLIFTRQTHTTNVLTADMKYLGAYPPKDKGYTDIDGLVTNERNVTLVSQYADCVPLAFVDSKKKVVATSHAGWRGTVGEIGKVTVTKMMTDFGCNPEDILVGIGPSVSKCCYEVDDLVINKVKQLTYITLSDVATTKPNGKYMLDLKELNRLILINCGIKPENIDVADICTCCESDTFYSHRVCGNERGNLALMICLK